VQDLEENKKNCKEYRSLQEKWRYQRNTSCKDGHNKAQKIKDLTEADEIKKRWQERTEELYKNVHNDRDRDDAGVTHIKPDILEYKIKWVLGSITTRKAMEFQLSCLKFLNNEAVEVLHSICQ